MTAGSGPVYLGVTVQNDINMGAVFVSWKGMRGLQEPFARTSGVLARTF